MPQSQEKQVKQEELSAKPRSLLSSGFITPVGNKIQPIYALQYDEKEKKELVVMTGEQDIDDFIQKSSSSTDMAFLQREAIRTGQYPVDSRASYGVDMTLMPSNIHELFNTTSDINTHFSKLGEHAQKAFGSADAYKDAVLNGTAEKILNSYFAKLAAEEAKKLKETDKEDK